MECKGVATASTCVSCTIIHNSESFCILFGFGGVHSFIFPIATSGLCSYFNTTHDAFQLILLDGQVVSCDIDCKHFPLSLIHECFLMG